MSESRCCGLLNVDGGYGGLVDGWMGVSLFLGPFVSVHTSQ